MLDLHQKLITQVEIIQEAALICGQFFSIFLYYPKFVYWLFWSEVMLLLLVSLRMNWLIVRLLDFCYLRAMSCLFYGRKITDGSSIGYPCAGQFAIGVPVKRVRQWLLPYGLILEDIRKIVLSIAFLQNASQSFIAFECIFLNIFLIFRNFDGISLGSIHIAVDFFLKNCIS